MERLNFAPLQIRLQFPPFFDQCVQREFRSVIGRFPAKNGRQIRPNGSRDGSVRAVSLDDGFMKFVDVRHRSADSMVWIWS